MASSVLLVALALLAAASAAPERLVGGTPTDIADFPYVLSLVYTYRPGVTVQRCVGALISSWHCLTTANCFEGSTLSFFTVRAGSTNSMSGGTTVGIAAVTLHPDYSATPRDADLAVTVFDAPLGLTPFIGVLYLPPPGTDIPDGTSTRVVSWGFETETNQLETLQSIYLSTVDTETCASAFADKDDAPVITATGVICANAQGRGICLGDSGAPMALGQVLVGIASEFYECGNDDVPDVFTHVASHTDWILSVATPPGKGGVPVRTAPVH